MLWCKKTLNKQQLLHDLEAYQLRLLFLWVVALESISVLGCLQHLPISTECLKQRDLPANDRL